MRPAMTMIPIKVARYGKVFVLAVGVGYVTHKSVDIVNVRLGQPGRVEVPNDCSSKDKVAIVEVVIVVVRVTKVRTIIASLVCGRGYYPAPSTYFD